MPGMDAPITIAWFRRDLRLSDNAALSAAARRGRVIPVFIADDQVDQLGAAAKLRLHLGLEALAQSLAAAGAPLIVRKGDALETLQALASETGADKIVWNRLTDGAAIARDTRVKAALADRGLAPESFGGHTLLEPWALKTGAGGSFKVFTPFWRALSREGAPPPLPAVERLDPAPHQPESLPLDSLGLTKPMNRAADALASRIKAGEAAARDQLVGFLDTRASRYADSRNDLGADGTSGLSQYLALGEISPRSAWAAMDRHLGDKGVEAARRQLVWRDFAHHLLFHDPEMETRNWRREWSAFPWRNDNDDARMWRAGRTGVDIVDAAMRELWVTGLMHNRARMLVASYLTKNLLTHWRVGAEWFHDCLIDWDPANNAMGWQWVAGCGPDAAPFFRIFNPVTQAEKFDKSGAYRNRWLGDTDDANAFKDTWPRRQVTSVLAREPLMVDLAATRGKALAAWEAMREEQKAGLPAIEEQA